MKTKFIIALFLVSVTSIFSQMTPGVKWLSFETEHYKFIFDEEMLTEALRAAQIAEETFPMLNENLHPKNFTKYPIILTADSSLANGYVTPMPKSSVWYPIPIDEGMGTTEWYTTLAIHEARHINQYNTIDQGFSRFLYYLGGASYFSIGLGSTPSWLFEGDAVVTETLYTESGRGRDPQFQSYMLAMAREDEQFNYYKMLNGSYRDTIPNEYQFGYFFTSWLEKEYGTEVINELFTNQAKVPLPLIGSSVAAKRSTGHTFAQLYKIFIEDIKLYADSIEVIPHPITPRLESAENRLFTRCDYLFNLNGHIYVMSSDMTSNNIIESIEDETRLRLSIYPYNRLNSNSNQLVWDELVTSPRYPMLSYSEIMIQEEGSNRVRNLTDNSRYFSPSISNSGDFIATIRKDKNRVNSLVILNSQSGEETISWELGDGINASWPIWNLKDSRIVFIAHNMSGKRLISLDLETEEFTPLTPWMDGDIIRPTIYKDWVFFSAVLGYTEEIYALSGDGILKQFTSSLYGSRNPLIVEEEYETRLYYINREGLDGDIILSINLDFDKALTLDSDILETIPSGYFEEIPREYETINNITLEIDPDYETSIEDYSIFKNSTNIISWGIVPFIDSDFTAIPLVLIYSNDLLNSMEWELSLRYDTKHKGFLGQYDAILKIMYPLIKINLTLADRPLTDSLRMDSSLQLVIPFGETRGYKDYSADLNASIIYTGIQPKSSLPSSSLFSVNYGVNFNYAEAGSYRSLQSKWLWQTQVIFSHTLDSDPAYRLLVNLNSNTPGFYKTHGFSFEGWYEQGESYGSLIPTLNGYSVTTGNRTQFTVPLQVEQSFMAGASYSMPLFYPDLPLGGLLYIKRFSLKIFYETQYYFESQDLLNSIGCELTTDFSALNFEKYDFNMGVRYSLLLEDGNYTSAVQFIMQQISF